MTASADIFAVRTGRATVLIGPPSALGEARGDPLLGRERDSAQDIELALEACRSSDAIRQYCARWGLDTSTLFYLDDLTLRAWLVAAVRHGHLGVALLPDVLFTAGAVQARVTETRARISARIDELMRSPAGAQLAGQPDKLIEALQAAARGEDPLVPPGRAAHERPELTPAEVQAMTLEDRKLELLRRALTSPELGAAVNQDMKTLLDPQTLATAIAVLTAWAATDAGKRAPLVDLALLAFGQVALDATLIEGLKNLAEALERTRQARHAADLTWATKRMVVAIALLGPRQLVRLIARGASNPYGVPLKTGGMKTRNKGISRPTPVERSEPRPPGPPDNSGTAKPEKTKEQLAEEHAKAAAAPCNGKGFSDPALIGDFVADFKDKVLSNWDSMSEDERFAAVKSLQESQFDKLGIPRPSIERSSDSAAGFDDPPTLFGVANDRAWGMTFNGNLFKKNPLSEHDKKELAKTMMHEGRHIEQYYKAAQYRAANGATAETLRTDDTATHKPMPIPEEVAKEAVKKPLPKKPSEPVGSEECDNYKKAAEWNDAKYGKGDLSQYRPAVAYKDRPLEKDAFALEPTIDEKW